MRKILYPYKMGSESGRQISRRLDAIRVYPDRNYRYRDGDLVINWGNSNIPDWDTNDIHWLNNPAQVKNASNKLTTFQILKRNGVNIPDFRDNKEMHDAVRGDELYWDKVIVRHKLKGHSGDGIEIVNINGDINYRLPDASLYTELINSTDEYRVHIFKGQIIDYTKKMRSSENISEPTTEQQQIRSHQNGWIFVRDGLRLLPRVGKIALQSIEALQLDFGAVDIILDEDGTPYVLEINCACGMENTTENNYTTAILNYELKFN